MVNADGGASALSLPSGGGAVRGLGARLRTERTTVDGTTYRPAGPVLQDLGYDYDLAGNLLTVRDRTPGSGIPGNPLAGTEGGNVRGFCRQMCARSSGDRR